MFRLKNKVGTETNRDAESLDDSRLEGYLKQKRLVFVHSIVFVKGRNLSLPGLRLKSLTA